MEDKAWVRMYNGARVVFIGFLDATKVAVSIDGHEQVMERVVWRMLPIASS